MKFPVLLLEPKANLLSTSEISFEILFILKERNTKIERLKREMENF